MGKKHKKRKAVLPRAQAFVDALVKEAAEDFKFRVDLPPEPMEAAILAPDGDGTDWIGAEPQANGLVSYSCLVQRWCCDNQCSVVETFVIMTPMPGYGVGAVINALEMGGNSIMQLVPLPNFMTPEEIEAKQAEIQEQLANAQQVEHQDGD